MLDGARLKGRWHLVRMKPRRGEKSEPWLLIKAEDEFARQPGEPEITDEETTSRISGKTNERARCRRARCAQTTKRARAPASAARCCCPTSARSPAHARVCCRRSSSRASPRRATSRRAGLNWIHEIKHDGYRIQARIDGSKVRLLTRHGLDWTARFRGIADALAELGLGSALIDGEIVVEDDGGITNLSHLQADLQAGRRDRFRYFTFDLLYCDGYDLTKASLIDRKDLLAQIIAVLPPTSPIRFSEHLEADGPTMLAHTCRLGLEGIISKRKDLPYRPGRGHHWFKAKCMKSQEFVILGYVASTAASGAIGSLRARLSRRRQARLCRPGRHRLVGGAGEIAAQGARQDQGRRSRALAKPLPAGAEKGVVWVEPRLVCEVEYRDWTRDGLIRNSSFKGLREDKPATEVTLEMPQNHERAAIEGARCRAGRQAHPSRAHPVGGARHHQAGPRGFLHRHRRLDFAAHHRARAEPAALPERHQRQVLLRQTPLGGPRQGGASGSTSASTSR